MPAALSPEHLWTALTDYKRALLVEFGSRLRRLALYGSRARGDARADSDVDVLVLIDQATPGELRQAVGAAFDTLMRTQVLLFPAAYATVQWEYLREIESPFALAVVRDAVDV